VAIMRHGQLLANPKSLTIFEAEDRIGMIGEPEQIAAAEKLLSAPVSDDVGVEWET
jgi:CPA2 family monovalent cation:H+ antiporter-2